MATATKQSSIFPSYQHIMMFGFSMLMQFVWLNPTVINGQILYNSSITNSSGQYFISHDDYDLTNGQIFCDSDTLCHIKCNHKRSCYMTSIYCNNASKCIIDCSGDDYTCNSAKFYISSMDTSITCDGWHACYGWSTIYTDYTNYPSSNVVLTCGSYRACDYMFIEDIYLNTSITRREQFLQSITNLTSYTHIYADKFKILCKSTPASNCFPVVFEPYPLATPTINNITGEYYTNIGSFITINCTHSSLCSVNCTNGACKKSRIDCGNSDKCVIICDDTWTAACQYVTVIAHDINEFDLQCTSTGGGGCPVGNYHIINVNSVRIRCDYCRKSLFQIQSVHDVHIECDFDGACRDIEWNFADITNDFSISCDGGCQQMVINIDGSDYFDIVCKRWWGDQYKNIILDRPCQDLEINAVSMNEINVDCQDKETCGNVNVCLDGSLNIDCPGEDSCNCATICDDIMASSVHCFEANSSFSCHIPTPSPSEDLISMPSKQSPTQYQNNVVTSEPTQSHQYTSYPTNASTNKIAIPFVYYIMLLQLAFSFTI